MDTYISEKLAKMKETEISRWTLRQDEGPNVRFSGWRIADQSSLEPQGDRQNRWTELRLYLTPGGKLICKEVGMTCWQGERERHTVYVCDTPEELIEKLGLGWLSKDLYDEAGIDHAVVID